MISAVTVLQFEVKTTIQWLLFTGTTCRDPCEGARQKTCRFPWLTVSLIVETFDEDCGGSLMISLADTDCVLVVGLEV